MHTALNPSFVYFYAQQYAQHYDDTIEMVTAGWQDMHSTSLAYLRRMLTAPVGWVLDIGSGTGRESLALLKEFSELSVVAVDISKKMNERFRQNFTRMFGEDGQERVKLLRADITALPDVETQITALLPSGYGCKFSCVISAGTFHHFPDAARIGVFEMASRLLRTGGVFINGDLYAYDDPGITEFALQMAKDWIAYQFDHPPRDVKDRLSGRVLAKLKKQWLTHYDNDNIHRALSKDYQLLKDLGFGNIAVPFRHGLLGLLCAQKQ